MMQPFPVTFFTSFRGVPSWVTSRYAPFGVNPDIAVDFVNNQAWTRAGSSALVSALLTTVCNAYRYRDDVSGNWTAFAPATAAYSNKGLRVWDARTNSLRNNAMAGAVVGTPGTLPMNWPVPNLAGLSQQVVAVGNVQGINYIDIRLFGTTNTTAGLIILESSTQVAALTGQIWSMSAFVAIVGGSLGNVTKLSFRVAEKTNTGVQILNNDGPDFKGSLSSVLFRTTYTPTLSGGGTTAFIAPNLFFGVNSGTAVDITLRIGWPQLEQASFAGPPIRTCNALRNNSMAGAVAGTPGTMPTNWTANSNSGLTVSIIGTGTDQGIDYIDIRYNGSNSGTFNSVIFETANAIAASSGQTWTGSVFYKIVAGSTTNATGMQVLVSGTNGVSQTEVSPLTPYALPPTAAWQRTNVVLTLANVGTTNVRGFVQFVWAASSPIDITVRLGWPQLEQAAAASLPQRTVAGTSGVNVPAENITLANPFLSSSGPYSLYGAGVPYAPAVGPHDQGLVAIDDGSGFYNNSASLVRSASNGTVGGWLFNAAVQISYISTAGPWAQNALGKFTGAFASADHGIAFNGGATITDTNSGALPAVITGHIGYFPQPAQNKYWDGDITEFAIWLSTRVPNANLVAGTQ